MTEDEYQNAHDINTLKASIDRRAPPAYNSAEGHANKTHTPILYSEVQRYDRNSHNVAPPDESYANLPQ